MVLWTRVDLILSRKTSDSWISGLAISPCSIRNWNRFSKGQFIERRLTNRCSRQSPPQWYEKPVDLMWVPRLIFLQGGYLVSCLLSVPLFDRQLQTGFNSTQFLIRKSFSRLCWRWSTSHRWSEWPALKTHENLESKLVVGLCREGTIYRNMENWTLTALPSNGTSFLKFRFVSFCVQVVVLLLSGIPHHFFKDDYSDAP